MEVGFFLIFFFQVLSNISLETLCMKGLVVSTMGRREEGIDLVRKGIKLDLTSHICWHVFGLIQKSDRNYEEALKSYTQALRFDKVRRDFVNLGLKVITNAGKHESPERFCATPNSSAAVRKPCRDSAHDYKTQTDPPTELDSSGCCALSQRESGRG